MTDHVGPIEDAERRRRAALEGFKGAAAGPPHGHVIEGHLVAEERAHRGLVLAGQVGHDGGDVKALSRLEARTPNVALFFHELGESLNRELQTPPPLNEWWRNLPAQRPTQHEIDADPVTAMPREQPTPAALPPPTSPAMFHRTVTAPTAHQAY